LVRDKAREHGRKLGGKCLVPLDPADDGRLAADLRGEPRMRQACDGQAVLSLRFGTVSHDLALVVLPFAAAVIVRVLALQEAAVRGEPVDGYPLPRPVRVPHEAATADPDAGLEGE